MVNGRNVVMERVSEVVGAVMEALSPTEKAKKLRVSQATKAGPRRLLVGQEVEAKWRGAVWFSGKIHQVNADGTYVIQVMKLLCLSLPRSSWPFDQRPIRG